jgi:Zn finger protein HypA/HybF involved in hydrogenase expression
MESVVEAPIYVNCVCNDCGHKCELETWIKSCPRCNSNNVSHAAMIRGL